MTLEEKRVSIMSGNFSPASRIALLLLMSKTAEKDGPIIGPSLVDLTSAHAIVLKMARRARIAYPAILVAGIVGSVQIQREEDGLAPSIYI